MLDLGCCGTAENIIGAIEGTKVSDYCGIDINKESVQIATDMFKKVKVKSDIFEFNIFDEQENKKIDFTM